MTCVHVLLLFSFSFFLHESFTAERAVAATATGGVDGIYVPYVVPYQMRLGTRSRDCALHKH